MEASELNNSWTDFNQHLWDYYFGGGGGGVYLQIITFSSWLLKVNVNVNKY